MATEQYPARKSLPRRLAPVGRGYTEIVTELVKIRDDAGFPSKRHTVAEALIWGYTSARTHHGVEKELIYGDIFFLVCNVQALWDGADYLSGALRAAQEFCK